ncbi:MAG: GAF domain-containing protein [Myxococcota bacterium]
MSGDDASGTSLEARTQAFLAEFFNRGQELVRDLIEENEALKSRLSAQESSRDPTGELVTRLRKQIADLEAECEQIRRLAGSVERESGGYRQRLEELETAHYHLAARQVSAEQLRRSTSVDEVLRATTEILLNLVGIGHFAIYGIDQSRETLFPLAVEGRDADPSPPELSVDDAHPVARGAAATEGWRVGAPIVSGDDTLMVLPLVCGGRAVAVAHLMRFLPQKHEFTDDDFALLELISEESGAALEAVWIRAHARDVSFTRPAVEALLT